MNNLDRVSVIIPCRNEEKFIGKCLDSIVRQKYPKDRLEVLVVDGMSEDRTKDIIKKYTAQYPFIKLLDNPKKIIPAALNIGIKEARGEIIMRMDAHAIYETDYIAKCVKYLDEYNVDNVGGTMITLPRLDTFMGRAIVYGLTSCFGVGDSDFRTSIREPKLTDTVFGGCYHKKTFEKIGYFDENIERSEDIEFNSRLKKAGYKILIVSNITSHYYAHSDFKDFCKHNFCNGVWAILPFKFTDHMPVSLRHLVPLIFVLSLIVLGLLSFLSSLALLSFLFIVLLYSVCNFYFSAQIAKKEKASRLLFIMFFIFPILHFSYGLGSIQGLFKVSVSRQFWKNLKAVLILNKMGKRAFDIIFSIAGLVILSPLLASIAVAIKLDDKGPIFYKGIRVGRFGVPFRIFKFRTMVINADKVGGPSTSDDDPRITKIGKSVRKYKLDELPQLINVLKGEMSFVGPRPEVPMEVETYSEEDKKILLVRPGITDWASLKFHNEGEIIRESKDPHQAYREKIRPEKLRLGLEYVKNHSLFIDFKILMQTFSRLFITRFGNK